MTNFDSNPFGLLTLVVAPAILTNASSVCALTTSNRLARAVERARNVFRKTRESPQQGDDWVEMRAHLLEHAHERTRLLVKAMTCFHLSVGCFAAAAVTSLIGAALFVAERSVLHNVALACALVAGLFGVLGLVIGSSLLVRETRITLRSVVEETTFWLDHQQPDEGPDGTC
ncbi:MAG: DUF2721 domain-containing protein [Pirellulales bacterium]|nr:DUF2721 domain-containing protein [Pirellulales bacterium]